MLQTSRNDRRFGVVWAAFLLMVSLYPVRSHGSVRIWALGASGLFLMAAVFAPGVLAPLNRVWTTFGLFLGKMMNPVVTGLLFVIAVVPTGFMLRLLGRDPMRLKNTPQESSYWIERTPPGPPPETMTNQF